MENKLTVLLVEDDQTECKAYMQYIDKVDDVHLLGIANNSAKAIECVQSDSPEVVILDLELHKGGGNGITFLKTLRELNRAYYPYIMIITNNISCITHDKARQLGADFIMTKTQDDYSAETVIEFLRMMKNTLRNSNARAQGLPQELATVETPEQLSKRIVLRITEELDDLGMSHKLSGRKYLRDAIELLIKNPNAKVSTIIGERYGKTDSSIEHAMKNAINKTWRTADIEQLSKYYTARIRSPKAIPTVTEFLYYYADKVKNSL